MKTPRYLCVTFENDNDAVVAVVHLNTTAPIRHRTVVVELTQDQQAILKPRCIDTHKQTYEAYSVTSLQHDNPVPQLARTQETANAH